VDVAVGGANSRLNVEKLLSVKELMRAKHVDFEREQIYCILTAKDESALMREAEITSRRVQRGRAGDAGRAPGSIPRYQLHLLRVGRNVCSRARTK
jgi:hypothetical protein